ncbi:unnamed protein product [Prorocentrum cordatum]|uniref:Uncharacterized protein n=1 Tax=Prorocentrum cordatum TaxID=2364126 RepID=A0ABN9XWL3_9DINO|nr:unnamed protein product [Polarella glacialis]
MAPLTNGANVKTFPGSPTQLDVVAVLTNFPETRKSQMTKLAKEIGDCLGAKILAKLEANVAEELGARNRPVDVAQCLASLTPAKFFEKMSGDAQQLDNAEDVGLPSLRGGVHLGRLANADEVYAPFAAFGLIRDDSHRSSANAQAVNEHAGTLNRLLQWVECPRATKSSGSHGGGLTPAVSLAWLGNIHLEIAAPMDRGALGSRAGATKERVFLYTGRPEPPRSALPDAYELPENHGLDVDMAVLSGMEELIGGPEAAGQAQLPRARPHADEAPEEGGDRSVRCRPDAEGFLFALPDGVPSRLRYCWANDEWVAEYRIGNKSIPLPPSHEITAAAERVPTLFSKAGGTVTLSEAAAKLMRSVSTFASVKASLAVEEGDNVTSALVAARGQVERAKRLLALLEGAREQWLDATDERRAKSVLRMSQQSAEFLAGLPAGFGLEQGQPSGLAGAEPSGAPAATARPPTKRARAQSAEPPASAQSSRPAASRADAVAGGADRGARGAALFAPLEGQAIAPGAQTQGAPPSALPAPPGALPSAPVCPRHAEAPPSATEPKQVADGAPMSRGCGPRGGTVQAFAEGQGEAWKTDRDIVRYTSQRGVVKCSEICGNLRREVMVNGRKKHLGLPQKVWEDVMAAALAQHPVGDLLEAGAPRSRVKWHAPPSAEAGREAMVKWRNLLVDMCRLTGREVRVLLQRARAPAASG